MPTKKTSTVQSFSGFNRSPGQSFHPYTLNFVSTSTSDSISHPGWMHAGSSDKGGPWFLSRVERKCSPMWIDESFAKGPYYSTSLSSWTGSGFSTNITDSEIITAGTKSIRSAAPTNPTAGLSTFIGELRSDGLPHMFGSGLLEEKTRFLKGSGSEYLNYEFGWLPMMSDLRKFAHAVKNSHDIIHQYRKASDTKIRRRRESDPVRGFTQMTGGGFLIPSTPSMSYVGSQTEETLIQSWFSGAFRYHVPVDGDLLDKYAVFKSNASKLLGLRLTPDVVWNVQPWTWAADWFANTGDVLTNISNLGTDGLVMQYGYQMLHRRSESTTYFTRSGKSGTYTSVLEQKRRIPASPYGFGLTFDGMTARQKAICAAIGITRVR